MGGKLQLEIHTATERSSFFPNREFWRAAKLGVNGYWQPQNVLQRKWLYGRNQGSEQRTVYGAAGPDYPEPCPVWAVASRLHSQLELLASSLWRGRAAVEGKPMGASV